MSTGKRLAKRSIVGTKVVVLREDGLYYPGVIQAVKTAEMDPSNGQSMSITKYAVRSMMEPVNGQPHTGRQQPQLREYSEVDLIGPGFQSTAGLTLQPGQKVFVTFTGREVTGHVTKHRPDVDEVHITLQATNANTVEIVKRMEEVRLMESRKSARLMDQHDVDFARLAEGGSTTITAGSVPSNSCILHQQYNLPGDLHQQLQHHHQHPARKRCSSASTSGIDVPGAFIGSRKRRSSPNSSGFATDSASSCSTMIDCDDGEDSDVMDECAAAMVLMRLSCSPHSPRWEELAAWQSNQSSTSSSSGAFSWRGSVSSSGDSPPHALATGPSVVSRAATNASAIAAGSSGVGRKLKFRSATPSPPLMSGSAPAAYAGNLLARFRAAATSSSTTNASTTIGPDDGIASDESISECDEGQQHSPAGSSQVRTITTYQCTFPGCSTTTRNCAAIESHVRNSHLGPRQNDDEISDHEEEFYYTEVEEDVEEDMVESDRTTQSLTPGTVATWPSRPATADGSQQHPTAITAAYIYGGNMATTNGFTAPTSHPGWMASSPPTLSHMDMARPPHEDPEYQRALMQMKAARPIAIPARVRSISWSSGYGYGSNPLKQAKVAAGGHSPGSSKVSPGASGVAAVNGPPSPAMIGGQTPISGFSVKSSPVRRPRGEAKKCRKVYGMEHREQWCTQCKWKKACTRFGD